MSAEENKAIVRTMLDALDREDWAAIEVHPGLYETRQHHPMVRATFPDLHHTIEQEMVDGDLVAIRAIAHGTHLGDFLGIAPTGKLTAFQVLLMDRIVDGKIVEHWTNADLASIMRQRSWRIRRHDRRCQHRSVKRRLAMLTTRFTELVGCAVPSNKRGWVAGSPRPVWLRPWRMRVV